MGRQTSWEKLELWKHGVYASREAVRLGILTPKASGKNFEDVRTLDFPLKKFFLNLIFKFGMTLLCKM